MISNLLLPRIYTTAALNTKVLFLVYLLNFKILSVSSKFISLHTILQDTDSLSEPILAKLGGGGLLRFFYFKYVYVNVCILQTIKLSLTSF